MNIFFFTFQERYTPGLEGLYGYHCKVLSLTLENQLAHLQMKGENYMSISKDTKGAQFNKTKHLFVA